MLNQLIDMIRTLVEIHQVTPFEEGSYGPRVMNNDERGSLPWGVRLEFLHFDGNNSIG